jgi:AcrR family transcriptional regulator
MDMADERLSAANWVQAGLRALAASGFTALKADSLAKALGVSRGSFYWHFADIDAFHQAVLRGWRQIAYDNIVEELQGSPAQRLRHLLSRAFRADQPLERAVRGWATARPEARAMVADVDARRRAYLERLLREAGIDPDRAAARVRILYWAYLGQVLAGERLAADHWRAVLDELMVLGLGAPER